MSAILTTEVFESKLYNTLPLKYKLDDESVDYALKRFLSALSKGGMNEVLEDVNGLLSLVDPDKVPSEYLPLLFKQYGFDYFNGIPEVYLRKMLPLISDLQDKKGSNLAVEYLTSILSGIRPVVEMDNNSKTLKIKLELSENSSDTPNADQLRRIVSEYTPFFFTVMVVYSYIFEEYIRIGVTEKELEAKINQLFNESTTAEVKDAFNTKITGVVINEAQTLIFNPKVMDSLLNKSYNQLEGNFVYTNAISSYDKVTNKNTNTSEYLFTLG